MQNIEIIESALTDDVGLGRFTQDLAWTGMSRLTNHSNAIEVTTNTIDQLLRADVNVGDLRLLLKMDVEGSEMEVLEGAADCI